jgi:hypothetical protein
MSGRVEAGFQCFWSLLVSRDTWKLTRLSVNSLEVGITLPLFTLRRIANIMANVQHRERVR